MILHHYFIFVPEFLLYALMNFPIVQYCVKYDDLDQMHVILLKIALPTVTRLGLELGLKKLLYYQMSMIKVTMR